MPPVAETFIEAVERAVGQRGISWRSLFTRLAAISDVKAASWKRSFARYRKGELVPEEETAAIIARALEVPRSSLPAVPASRRRTADRLAALEDQVGRLTAIVERLVQAEAQGGRGGRRVTG